MSGAPDRTADKNPEITTEMIRAGVDCLNRLIDHATAPGEGVQSISKEWVREAYLEMLRNRPPAA
jgi:hypothetical protein